MPKAVTAHVSAGDTNPKQGGPNGAAMPAGSIPFKIAGRQSSRQAFSSSVANLAAGLVPLSPIPIQPSGFIRWINLEVTIASTGGTPTFAADAPFNVLNSIEFRNAAGNDIIPPVTGYQLFLMNKYGCQMAAAPFSDPRNHRQYTTSGGNAHFYLAIPLEIDPSNGYGSIPALAANRVYQLNVTLSALSQIYTSAPTSATVTINATTYYWTEPPREGPHGMRQATHPNGVGTTAQWQIEQPSVNPGDRKIKSNNVGNLIRLLIFTIRNSSGVRIDTNGVPALSEILVDNAPLFYLPAAEWEWFMALNYGFTAATKDVAVGLDTGVYVMPFFALTEGLAGVNAGHRGQYLSTLDSSLLELRGTSWGSAVSGVEILTQSVVPSSDRNEAGGSAAAFYGEALRHH